MLAGFSQNKSFRALEMFSRPQLNISSRALREPVTKPRLSPRRNRGRRTRTKHHRGRSWLCHETTERRVDRMCSVVSRRSAAPAVLMLEDPRLTGKCRAGIERINAIRSPCICADVRPSSFCCRRSAPSVRMFAAPRFQFTPFSAHIATVFSCAHCSSPSQSSP